MGHQPEREEWFGVHLSFHGSLYSPVCDRVILDIVAPVISTVREQCSIRQYFFIRYNKGGSHIRLRLRCDSTVFAGHALPLLDQRCQETSIRGGVSLRVEAYEPELDRYGGTDGVLLAERWFELSSDTAIALLKDFAPGDQRARFAKSLFGTLTLVHAVAKDHLHAQQFLDRYTTNYLRAIARQEQARSNLARAFDAGFARQGDRLAEYITEAWYRLDEGQAPLKALQPWVAFLPELHHGLETLARAGTLRSQHGVLSVAEAMHRIVPSYLHMANNRLGVTIPEEVYLATMIGKALPLPAGEPA